MTITFREYLQRAQIEEHTDKAQPQIQDASKDENAGTNLDTIQTQVQMLKKENISHKQCNGNGRYKDTDLAIVTS